MKIIICGKGGSGKSTLAALIAVSLKHRGYSVLLVDADESNLGLHRRMGISHPESLLANFGGKKGYREKVSSAFPPGAGVAPFDKKIRISEIPEACVARANGIRLLVIGKIHHFGEGCACPMGAISRMILSQLVIEKNEIVLIDTAAGVEHFGRRIDAEGDLILGVVDPTFESFVLAERMQNLALEAETEIRFVLNKVDEQVEAAMMKNIDSETVIARIPHSTEIVMDSLEGRELTAGIPETDSICQWIENFKKVT
ncbi:P-loop NTPase [Thermodesulfobacteriota bacterium]